MIFHTQRKVTHPQRQLRVGYLSFSISLLLSRPPFPLLFTHTHTHTHTHIHTHTHTHTGGNGRADADAQDQALGGGDKEQGCRREALRLQGCLRCVLELDLWRRRRRKVIQTRRSERRRGGEGGGSSGYETAASFLQSKRSERGGR